MKLSAARILLTGATGGIGSALADRLRLEGCELLVQGRSRTVEDLPFVRADMKHDEDLATLAGAAVEYDINVLINASGINQFSAFEESDIDHLIAVNVAGPMKLTQLLLPHLKSKPDAVVLNIGSTFGQIGFPGYVAYCATKHAIKGFSEALRRELIDTHVRVQHVSPRATNTTMNSETVNNLNAALGTASDEPEFLAGKIVQILQTGKSRLQMGGPEKAQVKINSLLPELVDAMLAKQLPTIREHYQKLEA